MSEVTSFDLIVIGGGPAGYIGAIRAAQLGMSVACVERDRLGGVCLNWGCIPTKALLANAELYEKLTHDADKWGITAQQVSFNWEKVIGRSRGVADNLNRGIGALFKKHKITHLLGSATVTNAVVGNCSVRVTLADGTSSILKAKNVLVCTGAAPRALPGVPFDDKVITSKEAMTLKEQPKSLAIIGAGPIGMEFAYFYNAFGTKVTVIEMLDRLLPNEDAEVSKAVERAFIKQGILCKTSTKTNTIRKTDKGIELCTSPTSDPQHVDVIEADKVLIAIGVKGKFDGVFSDTLLPKLEVFKDHIKVALPTYKTSLPGIYAAGDVIGPPWLAHVAMEEAVACIEHLAADPASGARALAPGEHRHVSEVDYSNIPGCTYCHPQVASVGLTEQQCKDKNIAYKVGKFPFTAAGKAQASGNTDGFVKIIADPKYGEILGAHLVGENVTELIAEIILAKKLEATVDELIDTMHAHPTLSEAVHEAALGTKGRMLHF